jgi:hypothetical protein
MFNLKLKVYNLKMSKKKLFENFRPDHFIKDKEKIYIKRIDLNVSNLFLQGWMVE